MRVLARNADGDQLLFLHAGRGEFFCDYGHLAITAGDYVVIPARHDVADRGGRSRWACCCSRQPASSFKLPDRGIVGAHAIFDPAILDVPALDDAFAAQQQDGGEWRCR